MTNCPRCGAVNKPGRPSCWKCWSPLPTIDPAHGEGPVANEIVETPPSSERVPVSPQAPPVEIEPAHAPVVIPSDETRERPIVSRIQDQKAFAFVAEPSSSARKGSRWLSGAIVLTTLLLVGAILGWYLSFHREPASASAEETGRSYLLALVTYDVGTQQQLATEASKSTMFPNWFVVASAHLNGAPVNNGDEIKCYAQINLAPAPSSAFVNDVKLKPAFARTYQVPVKLVRESGNWHVNQTAFLADLQHTVEDANQNLTLPAWQ